MAISMQHILHSKLRMYTPSPHFFTPLGGQDEVTKSCGQVMMFSLTFKANARLKRPALKPDVADIRKVIFAGCAQNMLCNQTTETSPAYRIFGIFSEYLVLH